uniref:G_PROTEIN_RECEP_F1_2 domain-containing protein n=1 Tax=Heterorhabditis bacteriophora TaxID=37862 RepID=A0A1I7WML7_HETBA
MFEIFNAIIQLAFCPFPAFFTVATNTLFVIAICFDKKVVPKVDLHKTNFFWMIYVLNVFLLARCQACGQVFMSKCVYGRGGQIQFACCLSLPQLFIIPSKPPISIVGVTTG